MKLKKREAGGVLIMSVVILVFLTLLGLTAMQTASVDLEAAATERGANRALFIAESGIHWGMQEVAKYGIDPNTPDYTQLWTDLTPVNDSQSECDTPNCPLFTWYQLHSLPLQPYASGYYKVAVCAAQAPSTCDDDLGLDAKTLMIRSMGWTQEPGADWGERRVIEVALTPMP